MHLVKIFEGILLPDRSEAEPYYGGKLMLIKQRVQLLTYYLIQFRNHQSNNFNILNLSLSVFIHHAYKTAPRFKTYIARIIRCVAENVKTHESEIEKDMFLGTEIANSLREFPFTFPGMFEEAAPTKLKTLEKAYKWFFTDDNVEFVSLLAYFELSG